MPELPSLHALLHPAVVCGALFIGAAMATRSKKRLFRALWTQLTYFERYGLLIGSAAMTPAYALIHSDTMDTAALMPWLDEVMGLVLLLLAGFMLYAVFQIKRRNKHSSD